MKHVIWLALCAAAGCSQVPVQLDLDRLAADNPSCEVAYPQVPRCECGCAGDLCTTQTLGVVVCDASGGVSAIRTSLVER